ncbi:uncharacterized protein LOC128552600, partial [Mercenaria mercenaria]|uniref:uncharacterized protein LOC128552600 n=1 Tax=Mercenaria mercenaria TaxID=6596 RepID=UPI00234F1756
IVIACCGTKGSIEMGSLNKLEDDVQWFRVDIPENTERLTSLQRIRILSKKTRKNNRIFVHCKDDKAFFKFLGESSTFSLFEGKELTSDPEVFEYFIVQDGREILVCENNGELFENMFPKGRGRKIKYTALLERTVTVKEMNLYHPKSEFTKCVNYKVDFKHELNKMCISDNIQCLKPSETNHINVAAILLKTGTNVLDDTEDPAFGMFGTTGKKVKYRDFSRCKPARKQYELGKEAAVDNISGKQEVEPCFYAYPAGNVKTSDEGTSLIKTLPCLEPDPELKEKYQQSQPDECLDTASKQTDFNFAVEHGELSIKSEDGSRGTQKRLSKDKKKNTTELDIFVESDKLDSSKKAERKRKSTAKSKLSRKVAKSKGRGFKKRKKNSKKRRKKSRRKRKKQFKNRNDSSKKHTRIYKEQEKKLRELTDLCCCKMPLEVNAYLYPIRREREGGASHNPENHTVGNADAEEIPNQSTTGATDDETQQPAAELSPTEGLNDNVQVSNLPEPEVTNNDLEYGQILTSADSIFQNNTRIQTTNLATADAERSLVNRLGGELHESRSSQPQAPPRYHQFADQPSRQRSFSNWPSTTGQNPSRMVANGFFYTGRCDLIRCFQCGISLKDWSVSDDPLIEHIKHSPNCQFLKDLLGQELLNEYKHILTACRQTHTNRYTAVADNQEPRIARVGTPEYSQHEARIHSFAKWPAFSQQSPQDLADAGLFYTGFRDLCRCFTCDGGLQHWEADDDPWIEHARWFPQCTYVRHVKGQEYINMVQQAAAQAFEEENPVGSIPEPGQFQRNTLAEAQRQDVGRVLPPDTPPEGDIFTLDCQA